MKFVVMLCASTVLLSGCANFVKRDEFDSAVIDLRNNDARLEGELAQFRGQFSEMTQDLHTKFECYDATIANLQGRLHVEMSAHFEYDAAELREADKPALDEFSDVIRRYEPNIIITVEGFTDPAGNADYNRALGLRRANAVREYLVNQGNLSPDRVKAVSYGEDKARQLSPGAWGDDGNANRRVSLVVDYVGPSPRGVNPGA